MQEPSNYLNFLKKNGRPLSEINPGSDEIALNLDDVLKAIEYLKDEQLPILGGDVLSDKSGKFVYTYENWYCEKQEDETQKEYCERSYYISKTYLSDLISKNGKNYYVVIVT